MKNLLANKPSSWITQTQHFQTHAQLSVKTEIPLKKFLLTVHNARTVFHKQYKYHTARKPSASTTTTTTRTTCQI